MTGMRKPWCRGFPLDQRENRCWMPSQDALRGENAGTSRTGYRKYVEQMVKWRRVDAAGALTPALLLWRWGQGAKGAIMSKLEITDSVCVIAGLQPGYLLTSAKAA